jgi:predicted transcriptional regulator
MATLIEMASEIVSAHVSANQMSTEELLAEIQKVHAALKSLEAGQAVDGVASEAKPALTIKQAFKKDEVVCMVCGKGGFKTLTRHLSQAHELKPGQYRKQFNIPSSQSLTAKNYSETRRQSALDRGLGDNLAKARKVRAENIALAKGSVKVAKPAKAEKPVKPVKAVKVAKPANPAKATTIVRKAVAKVK